MSRGISEHALERAQERYGFAPNHLEVAQILEDCRTGKAPCLRKNEIGRQHVARVRGGLMIVCLAPVEAMIITVFPRDYFNAGRSRAHHTKTYGGKTTPSASKMADNGDYNRAAWKREVHQDTENF